MLDNMGNIEYINLFVNKIETINKQSKNKQSIDLTLLSLDEISHYFQYSHKNILFDEKKWCSSAYNYQEIYREDKWVHFNTRHVPRCGHKNIGGNGEV